MGVAEAGDGTLIVTDYGNHRVKVVLPNGVVTNLYGVTSNTGSVRIPVGMTAPCRVPDSIAPNAQRGCPTVWFSV